MERTGTLSRTKERTKNNDREKQNWQTMNLKCRKNEITLFVRLKKCKELLLLECRFS